MASRSRYTNLYLIILTLSLRLVDILASRLPIGSRTVMNIEIPMKRYHLGSQCVLLRYRIYLTNLILLLLLQARMYSAPLQIFIVDTDLLGMPQYGQKIPKRWPVDVIYGDHVENARLYFDAETRSQVSMDHPFMKGGAPIDPSGFPNLKVRQWTNIEGLPANKVRSIYRGVSGDVWVGTAQGIVHMVGTKIDIYNDVKHIELAKNGSVVRRIYEDQKGNLWMGTKRGLLCWKNGDFKPFKGQAKFHDLMINDLASRREGGIWIVHNEGISFLDEMGAHELGLPPWVDSYRPMSIMEDADGVLWVGTKSNGILKLEAKNQNQLKLSENQVVHGDRSQVERERLPSDTAIYQMHTDRYGKVWIASGHGLWTLPDIHSNRPKYVVLGKTVGSKPNALVRIASAVARITEDGDGRIWTTLQENGLLARYDQEQVSFSQRSESWDCFSLHCDRDNSLWLGTSHGLTCLEPTPVAAFEILLNEGRRGYQIRAVEEANDGALWFRTDSGCGLWCRNRIALFDLPGDQLLAGPVLAHNTGLIGHPDGGICFIPDWRKINPMDTRINQLYPELGKVSHLLVDKVDGVWIATSNALHFWDLSTSNGGSPQLIYPLPEPLSVLTWGSDGNMVGATGNTLFHFNDGKIELIPIAKNKVKVLSLATSESEEGLWIGTDRGLAWLPSHSESPVSLGEMMGSAWSFASGLLEDDGVLWVNHELGASAFPVEGLSRMIREPNRPVAEKLFGKNEGFPDSSQAMRVELTCHKGNDGRLWFIKHSGLVRFKPTRTLFSKAKAPEVSIKNFSVDGSNVRWMVNETEQRHLSIDFGKPISLALEAHDGDSFDKPFLQYRLDGFSPSWNTITSGESISLPDIPPGRYELLARARDDDGHWSDEDGNATLLAVDIILPLWQRRTFWLPLMGFSIILLCGFLVWEGLRISKKSKPSTGITKEQLANDIHDFIGPIFGRMDLDNQRSNEEAIHREYRSALALLTTSKDTLLGLRDTTVVYLTDVCSANAIKCQFKIQEGLPDIPIASRRALNLLAMTREVTHNMVQHARATALQFSINVVGDNLVIQFADDGEGIETKSQPNHGLGLKSMRSRCKRMGGELDVHSIQGEGTTIQILLSLAELGKPMDLT